MTDIQYTNLSRYLFIFITAYIGITIVLAVVDYFISSTSINGVKLVMPMFAGIFVNDSFLKRNKRLYTSSEKEKLIWGGLLVVVLIEVLLSAIAIFSGAFSDAVISSRALIYLAVGSLLFMLILNYGLLMWVFGSIAEKRLKQIEKKHGSIGDVFN